MLPDRPVTLAAIAGAHGVAGEVRLKLFGDSVAALKRYRAFNGGALTVTNLRDDGKGGAIARFAEIADRNAAEALRGVALSVSRSALPELAEGEYYHADLIGLAVVLADGTTVGTCVAVENYGAGDIVEIERPANTEGKRDRFMVPMRAVLEWGARMVIDEGFAG